MERTHDPVQPAAGADLMSRRSVTGRWYYRVMYVGATVGLLVLLLVVPVVLVVVVLILSGVI